MDHDRHGTIGSVRMVESRLGRAMALAACLWGLFAVTAAGASDLPPSRPETARIAPPPVTEPAATGTLLAQAAPSAPAQVDEPDPVQPAPVEAAPDEAASAEPPKPPEFLRRSGSRAGGPANELNTGDARAQEKLPGGSVPAMLAGRDLYHGNFCGPGDRGPDAQPVDELDAVCQRHDACYTQAGRRSCGCDRALKTSALQVAATTSLSRELRRRAASVAESVPLMNCVEP
jgi:hypothetical protein